MSSVWNHVPNRQMVAFVRAAQSSSRSFRKGCHYSTSFRPIHVESLDPSANASLQSQNFNRPRMVIPSPTDTSSCEFWCSSRLILSRLNQQSPPLGGITEPWVPIFGRGDNQDVHSDALGPSRSPRIDSQSPQGNGSSNENPDVSKRPLQPTPPDFLIDTLQKTASRRRRDLPTNWTLSGNHRKPLITPLTLQQRQNFQKRARKPSLPIILENYIRLVDGVLQSCANSDLSSDAENLDKALQKILRGGFVDSLEFWEYKITDLMSWAWVLKSHTVYEATIRIYLLEADAAVEGIRPRQIVPVFIPLMLLRQELDLRTFRLLLVYTLHIITGRPPPRLDHSLHNTSHNYSPDDLHYNGDISDMPLIDPHTCAAFAVRLLSHARRLWPEAQLPIAQAFSVYLRTSGTTKSSFVAKKLNKFIQLLSLPSGPRPFVSASIRQEAQFELLKAMATMSPVLHVTRRGYQGLAAVQLAHRKTPAEREYAELQTPSWPPWKEERSGMDSSKGAEGRHSRAMRVMSQMREAGYRHSLWEEVAGIMAGWDTDNSPTIQTRALVRQPGNLRGRPGREKHHAIWEARIRSTRTLREAWACFLAHESQGFRPHASVYAAMGEKLIFVDNLSEQKVSKTSPALPGDGPEVYPEPASARDWIYTSERPPNLHIFLKRMLSHGIRPSGRFLALLLQHAPSFRVGLDCLSCSDLTNQQLRVLFSFGETIPPHDVESQQALDELPEYLLSAFIRFLCRFSVITSRIRDFTSPDAFPIITNKWAKPQPQVPTLFAYGASKQRNPSKSWYSKLLSHAIRLLRKRDSSKPQGWIQLLKGLRSIRVLGNASTLNHTQRILAWHESMEVSKWLDERNIDTGSDGFLVLCHSFSNAVAAAVKDPSSMERALKVLQMAEREASQSLETVPQNLEDMVHVGLSTLKGQFDRLLFGDSKTFPLFDSLRISLEQQTESQVTVPMLPDVPSPAVFHAFVRCLGLAEDSEGLLSLLRWMSQHATILKQKSDEHLNGDIMMRRTIVAARMFLEGYWGSTNSRRAEPTADEADEPDPLEHITPNEHEHDVPTFWDTNLQEAYDIVTATEIWGPWPSDEEVLDYLAHEERKTEQ
ncbi:hypothetical protein BDV06DRAFT_195574 [Aspergillus oleicola]